MADMSRLTVPSPAVASAPRRDALLPGFEDSGQAFEHCFRRHWAEEPSLGGLPPPGSGIRVLHLLAALVHARPRGARFQTLCRRLARVWRRRGAGALHVDAGGAALLRSLADCLGPAFEENEDGLAVVYGEAAEAMLTTLEDGHIDPS